MSLTDRIQRINASEELELDTVRNFSHTIRAARVPEPSAWNQMKTDVRQALMEELDSKLYTKTSRHQMAQIVAAHLDKALERSQVVLSTSRRPKFVAELTADLLGYGPLEELLADPEVTEVMCNGHDDIYVERGGKIVHTDVTFADEAHLRQVIDRIVATVGRRIDESSPMVDARMPDGSRINAVLPPVSVDGPALTIRRFPAKPFTMEDLIKKGSISAEAAAFLKACVVGKLNIVVSGGTGTGKTTLLNLLADYVPADERIITIEDSAEMRLSQPHVVRMEARQGNIEGAGEVLIWDLVRNALRMRPDRIMVGEVRGPEALDMLQAMNTGHEGSITTVHANSPRDALSRIETMVLMSGYDLPLRAVRQQQTAALDLLVHVDRFGDGSRHVTRITEVQGSEEDVVILQDIFAFEFSSGGTESAKYAGTLRSTGLQPRLAEKLTARGVHVPQKALRPVISPLSPSRVRVPAGV